MKTSVSHLLLFVIVFSSSLLSQDAVQEKAPKLFIDCTGCDYDYIRKQIPFVNYVIDRKDADIYVLITSERRGGGGRMYTLNVTGRNAFSNQSKILTFTTQEDDTGDMIRSKMVKSLKLGIVPFIVDTPLAEHLQISYSVPQTEEVIHDPWNNWVFRTNLGGNLEGEKSTNAKSMHISIGAERVTEEWKIRMGAFTNYREERYHIGEGSVIGIARGTQFESMIVKSLSNHWSLGAGLEAGSSSYSNLLFSSMAYPAIEYNIFPYSESTRREFRIWYGAGLGYNDYEIETIYGKTKEWLWGQRMGIELETQQEWGRIDVSLDGMNYFPEMDKNHLRLFSNISLHLVRGLSFAVHGGVSMIHDQIALPKRGASNEEILLKIRELETQYNYWFSLGFEYTFGSIYNNIVNSRFGNGG